MHLLNDSNQGTDFELEDVNLIKGKRDHESDFTLLTSSHNP